ncbi:MAG: DUF4157 domain-containing protein [Thermoanaerobaculales bacterium]|nr:DUF4157 domain-containing protein [Thermoanaerobaculales bacterium]
MSHPPAKVRSRSSPAASPAPGVGTPAPSVPKPATPASVSESLQGGRPLAPSTRQRMESSFRRPLDDVRVHTDAVATSVADRHGAEALTVGNKIAFGAGRYRPDSPTGDHLIAHELAHVVQQGGAAASAVQPRNGATRPGEPLEASAEAAATRVVRGEPAAIGPVSSPTTRSRILRRARLGAPAVTPRLPRRRSTRPADLIEVAADTVADQAQVERAKAPGTEPEPEPEKDERAAAETAAAEAKAAPAAPPATAAAVAEAARAEPEVRPSAAEDQADAKDEAEAATEARDAEAEAKAADEPGAEAAEPAAEAKKAPASPEEDPAFASVIHRVRAVARAQAHNNAAERKAAEAQAAAKGPPNEVEGEAAGLQVAKMAEQEPKAFDKAKFKQALLAEVARLAPQSIDDIDNFKSSGKTAQLKQGVAGHVESSKEEAQGAIKGAAEETPSGAGVTPKTVTPQPPTVPGPPPGGVGAGAAAPKPRSDAEVSLEAGKDEVEQKWRDNDLSEDKLRRAQEPEFEGAISAKQEVAEHAEKDPAAFRDTEAGVIGAAKSDATSTAAAGTGGMYATRSEQFSGVAAAQDTTKTADEVARQKVIDEIKAIYDTTEKDVLARLKTLDSEVSTAFDAGADAARKSFDDNVETKEEAWRREHPVLSVAERLGWPVDLDHLYQQAKREYIAEMDGVIDTVVDLVDTGLTEAKKTLDAGRQKVEAKAAEKESVLGDIGKSAVADIQSKFDGLEQTVKDHEGQLVKSLAENYAKRLEEIDKAIEKMNADNRGWVGRALDEAQSVVDTYEKIRALLARFGDIVDAILDDPGQFLSNLFAGIKAGVGQFLGNILSHLKKGLMEWLFGAAASAGIEIPDSFDLKSIIKLVLGILGLTYANFRARAVAIVGEPIVKAMETGVEIFRILLVEGIGGLWRFIKDMVGDLKTMILDGIISWVKEKIIVAGITWIIGLLNPVGGLIKIANAIIKVVDFFLTRGAQIMALANAVVNSLSAIVGGAIGAMAGAIENALAKAIPVTIGFLAALAGIGGVSEMIKEQIAKAQKPVNKAIDFVINKAVKLAKKIGGLLGGGKKKDQKEPEATSDPEHDAKVDAGLAAIPGEEAKHLKDGGLEEEDAAKVAASVKRMHPVFKSLTVVDGGEDWDYAYTASPKGTRDGTKKREEPKVKQLSLKRASFSSTLKEQFRQKYPNAHTAGGQLKKGIHRRHIIPFTTLRTEVRSALERKTYTDANSVLKGEGKGVTGKLSQDAINRQAQSWLNEKNNDLTNLWPGGAAENIEKSDKEIDPKQKDAKLGVTASTKKEKEAAEKRFQDGKKKLDALEKAHKKDQEDAKKKKEKK